MKIVERMFLIMAEKGVKPIDLANKLNINKGVVSNWKSRITNPPAEYLVLICELLNVSLEYLITGKESNIVTIEVEKRIEQLTGDTGRMTDAEVDIIHKFRELDERDQEDTIAYVNMKYKRTTDIQKRISSKYQSGEEITVTLEKRQAQ